MTDAIPAIIALWTIIGLVITALMLSGGGGK